jgi:hypothetical protein
VTALFPAPAFSYTSTTSTLKTYTFTQESGIDFTFQFCSDCGVAIGKSSEHEAFNGAFILFVGTLDGGEEVFVEVGKPELELWGEHKASWLGGIEGAEVVKGMGPVLG